jgi:hypothetical protein
VTDPRWERAAAGAGIGAAVLLAIQTVVAPLYPWYDDPLPRVSIYYAANASAIRVQVLLTGAAGVLFLWWLGSLRVHLRRAEGDPGRLSVVAFGSAIAASGIAGLGALATLVATRGDVLASAHAILVPSDVGSVAIVSAVGHELRLASYTLSWFALAPMLAAVAVISARDGAFPRWHMNASYVLTVLALATALSVLIDTGPFAPGGVYTLVLYGLFVVWLGLTSWLTMRALEPPTTVSTAPDEPPPPSDTQPIPPLGTSPTQPIEPD